MHLSDFISYTVTLSSILLDMSTLNASCHCGAVTIQAEKDSVKGIVKCYCRDCQKHLGNFAPWVVCNKENSGIAGPVGEYASSPTVKRLFCTSCGSSLAKSPNEGSMLLVAAGCFEQPLDLEVVKEVFVEAKEPWMLSK